MLRVERAGEGFMISASYEGDKPPMPPKGYRSLRPEEEPQIGDIVFNVITETWNPLTECVMATARQFGRGIYRFPPARKCEE